MARTAVPCIDEPDKKAKFSVRLGRPKNMTSRSNMEIIRTEPIEDRPGYELDVYKETPIQSTYLLAFFISDFEELKGEVSTKDKTYPYNVLYRPGLKDQVIFGTTTKP